MTLPAGSYLPVFVDKPERTVSGTANASLCKPSPFPAERGWRLVRPKLKLPHRPQSFPSRAFGGAYYKLVRNIAIGLISGIALAEPAMLLLNRLLAASPRPLHRFDSTVFGISAILLAAVSLIAMYIPASRAMRTDPMRV
jgi:hypothetical protein